MATNTIKSIARKWRADRREPAGYAFNRRVRPVGLRCHYWRRRRPAPTGDQRAPSVRLSLIKEMIQGTGSFHKGCPRDFRALPRACCLDQCKLRVEVPEQQTTWQARKIDVGSDSVALHTTRASKGSCCLHAGATSRWQVEDGDYVSEYATTQARLDVRPELLTVVV